MIPAGWSGLRTLRVERRPDGTLEIALRGAPERLEVSRRHAAEVRRYVTGEG